MQFSSIPLDAIGILTSFHLQKKSRKCSRVAKLSFKCKINHFSAELSYIIDLSQNPVLRVYVMIILQFHINIVYFTISLCFFL